MAEQFVLLWSKQANDMKIEPLEAYLSACRQAYKDNQPVEWVPTYVGERGVVASCLGHCAGTLIDRETLRKPDPRAQAHLQPEASSLAT
jgi:hypothetical protein